MSPESDPSFDKLSYAAWFWESCYLWKRKGADFPKAIHNQGVLSIPRIKPSKQNITAPKMCHGSLHRLRWFTLLTKLASNWAQPLHLLSLLDTGIMETISSTREVVSCGSRLCLLVTVHVSQRPPSAVPGGSAGTAAPRRRSLKQTNLQWSAAEVSMCLVVVTIADLCIAFLQITHEKNRCVSFWLRFKSWLSLQTKWTTFRNRIESGAHHSWTNQICRLSYFLCLQFPIIFVRSRVQSNTTATWLYITLTSHSVKKNISVWQTPPAPDLQSLHGHLTSGSSMISTNRWKFSMGKNWSYSFGIYWKSGSQPSFHVKNFFWKGLNPLGAKSRIDVSKPLFTPLTVPYARASLRSKGSARKSFVSDNLRDPCHVQWSWKEPYKATRGRRTGDEHGFLVHCSETILNSWTKTELTCSVSSLWCDGCPLFVALEYGKAICPIMDDGSWLSWDCASRVNSGSYFVKLFVYGCIIMSCLLIPLTMEWLRIFSLKIH